MKRSAGCSKAGLSHGVILGMELERDDVSNGGGLKEVTCEHNIRYVKTCWLTYDERGIIEEACSIIADIDPMSYWGGRG